ncbi:hypothetical protein ACTFIW_003901 [Dictyostelium discoideum]
MKEPMFSYNTNSRSQRSHDDSDTENEQSEDESSNNVDVPTDYQLSDTLLGLYKHMVTTKVYSWKEKVSSKNMSFHSQCLSPMEIVTNHSHSPRCQVIYFTLVNSSKSRMERKSSFFGSTC